jgi:hypothetical protein
MKIQGNTTVIERTGASESKGFAIKASAQAFRILSDGLYSDKVKAVLRELSSNAWDAHIQAGTTDTPFLVHLPNNIEPWFSIRDYGIGLAHEQVMGLYSTYFDSTKDESNDFTGAMGLGSKSPFSYTDSFTVTSYYNGEQRIYIVDIGNNGVPQISLVDGAPFATDQHNGLEIKLAVKSNDFGNFQDKAQQVYRWYPLLPKVVGVAGFRIEKVEYLFEGTDWKMIKKSSWNNPCYAVQGTVAYPIKADNLQGADRSLRNLIDGMGVQINFAIGELEVSASREDLGYDERTSENLLARINTVIEELTQKATERLASCESLWDAKIAFNEMKKESGVSRLIDQGALVPTWNGNELNKHTAIRIDTSADMTWHTYDKKSGYSSAYRILRKYSPLVKNQYSIVVPQKEFVLAINDAKTGGINRFKHYISENVDSNNRRNAILFTATTQAAIDTLRDKLGLADDYKFLLTSEMDKAPVVSRGTPANKLPAEKVMLGQFNPHYNSTSEMWGRQEEIDVTEGGFFVQTHGGLPDIYLAYNAIAFNGTNNLQLLWQAAIAFKLIDDTDPVYNVPRNKAKKVRKNGKGCKDLVKLVYEYINKNKDTIDVETKRKMVADQVFFKRAFVSYEHNRAETLADIGELAKSKNITLPKDVQLFVDGLGDRKYGIIEEYVDRFERIAVMMCVKLEPTNGNGDTLKDQHDQLLSTYPMIRHLNRYDTGREMHLDIIAYMKLVDNN